MTIAWAASDLLKASFYGGATVSATITATTPASAGALVCTAPTSPPLPTGMTYAKSISTCVLGGTAPSTQIPSTTYTFRVNDGVDFLSLTLNFAVGGYSLLWDVLPLSSYITSASFPVSILTASGSSTPVLASTSCSVFPALPSPLSFAQSSATACTLSGSASTASTASTPITYTFSVISGSYSASISYTFGFSAVVTQVWSGPTPLSLSVANGSPGYVPLLPIFKTTLSAGTVSSVAATPSLPTGLSFSVTGSTFTLAGSATLPATVFTTYVLAITMLSGGPYASSLTFAIGDCTNTGPSAGACGLGQYCSSASICMPCPAGSYNSIGGGASAVCIPCTLGYLPNTAGTSTGSASKTCIDTTGAATVGAKTVSVASFCPAGSYGALVLTSANYIAACLACPTGTYSTIASSTMSLVTACRACNLGNLPTSLPTTIPAGTEKTYMTGGSGTSSTIYFGVTGGAGTAAITYTGATVATCITTISNTYGNAIITSADFCSSGSYGYFSTSTTTTGAAICQRCPAGSYATKGTSAQTVCSAMTVGYTSMTNGNDPGTTAILPATYCTYGTFGVVVGNIATCAACTPGSYCDGVGTGTHIVTCATTYPSYPYSASGAGTSSCSSAATCGCVAATSCPAGYSCTNGATVKCPAGQYSYYGDAACSSCPTTFPFTSAVGSAGVSYCIDVCPSGYSCGATSQSICPAGYFSSTGSMSCQPCTGGTYSSAGDQSCTSCVNNALPPYSLAGSDVTGCSSTCPAGYACPTTGGSPNQMYICPSGTYSAAGSASCTACPYNAWSSPGTAAALPGTYGGCITYPSPPLYPSPPSPSPPSPVPPGYGPASPHPPPTPQPPGSLPQSNPTVIAPTTVRLNGSPLVSVPQSTTFQLTATACKNIQDWLPAFIFQFQLTTMNAWNNANPATAATNLTIKQGDVYIPTSSVAIFCAATVTGHRLRALLGDNAVQVSSNIQTPPGTTVTAAASGSSAYGPNAQASYGNGQITSDYQVTSVNTFTLPVTSGTWPLPDTSSPSSSSTSTTNVGLVVGLSVGLFFAGAIIAGAAVFFINKRGSQSVEPK